MVLLWMSCSANSRYRNHNTLFIKKQSLLFGVDFFLSLSCLIKKNILPLQTKLQKHIIAYDKLAS